MSGKKGFDYSKWDNIEISDDESDCHPNIDKDSWFRMKHRSRVEREDKEEQEKRNLTTANRLADERIADINTRLLAVASGDATDGDAAFEDPAALRQEAAELTTLVEERTKILEEMEKNKKWNVDNICHVAEEASHVTEAKDIKTFESSAMKKAVTEAEKNLAERDAAKSKAEEVPLGPDAPPPPPPASAAAASTSSALAASAQGPVDERHVMLGYGEFCELYEEQMEHFLSIPNMEGARDYLHKNGDILLAEHAQSYILLSCLENEMNGKTAKAELECRHSQVLSHVCELATSMGKNPRDMVLPFFVRMQEEVHNRGFLEQVAGFVKRIKTRAIAKRKEMDAEAAANPEYVEMTEEERLGPGGLDPVQVMETLPQSMQDAFQARDIPALQAALDAMPADEASKHMKRCIDSGLWSA